VLWFGYLEAISISINTGNNMRNINQDFGFVLFFDVFGFSSIVRQKDDKIITKLLNIWRFIDKSIVKKDVHAYLFSDCGFLFYPTDNKIKNNGVVLEKCVDDTQILMNRFLEKDLFLRGGISYGKVNYNNRIIIGEPILEAVAIEKDYCPGPFIIIPQKEINRANLNSEIIRVIKKSRIISLKKGKGEMLGSVILPNDKVRFMDKINLQSKKYLENGPFELGQYWRETRDLVIRYSNTED
jgi:hypothetical protein